MEIKGKNVVVTGADGFIGSHLTELLVKEGAKVKGLSQYNSFNNWGWLENVQCKDDIEIVTGDIRDANFCRKLTNDAEVVFHLAALIAIPFSYVAPQSYIDTNISGTLNMCQASLDNGVQKFIHTSTSEVYGSALYVPIDEAHPKQPQSPYSASKISADAIAMSFYNSFNFPLTVVRPFNTYGPRQSARAVIPSLIIQLAGDVDVIKVGDLSPTRDFNFVTDTCKGFIELAKCDKAIGQEINVGSNYEISMLDTFNLISQLMGKNVKFEEDMQRIRPRNSEVNRLWCDNTKLHNLTGYKPETDLKAGLKKTVEWFLDKSNLSKYKINIYNI